MGTAGRLRVGIGKRLPQAGCVCRRETSKPEHDDVLAGEEEMDAAYTPIALLNCHFQELPAQCALLGF
ncbi:hypothetical protein AB4Z10_27295 [Bosea sp. RAF48]|uniref:hypothetical protein n=1 Tax=Bosea sp. RAF48 TaxID=3237480 RepID=UPI003F92FFDC